MAWTTREKRAVGPAGRMGLHGCGWGNLVYAGLHLQWEGDTGAQGAAETSVVTVICSAMKSLLVKHYLLTSCLG